jgi:hypothetical protein
MKRVEFITLEDEQDLIVSFALAPAGQHSLTLLRAPQYEYLLPEENRRPTVSLSSAREEGDYLTSVLWKGSHVEVHSEKHAYVLDASPISEEEKAEAVVVLRKLAKGGVFRLQVD